jgi:hypothetical protein
MPALGREDAEAPAKRVSAGENYTTRRRSLYPLLPMTRATVRRQLALLGIMLGLPFLAMGCPKKAPPPVQEAEAPPPASTPTVTDIAPITDTDDAGDAAPEAAAKKWTGPAMNPNQAKIAACCNAMRAQAKQIGQSPEAFQINALAAQCDLFAKQVGPQGTAPEFAQLRAILKSVKLPSACQF